MDKIPAEMEQQYHMPPYAEFTARHTAEDYWRTFLIQTDHVALKIAEATFLGTAVDEKYREILAARELCRQKINEITEAKEVG